MAGPNDYHMKGEDALPGLGEHELTELQRQNLRDKGSERMNKLREELSEASAALTVREQEAEKRAAALAAKESELERKEQELIAREKAAAKAAAAAAKKD